MKNTNQSIGRFVELFDIEDVNGKSTFELQVRRYLGEMAASITCWSSPGNTEDVSLARLDQCLYEQFGLTSQALRILATLQQSETLDRSRAVDAASALISVHLEALNDEFTLESTHLAKLLMIDRFMGMFLKISSASEARELKALDYAGWHHLLGNGRPALRIAKLPTDAIDAPSTSDIQLTESQTDIVRKIEAFWNLKRCGLRIAGYDPRPIPLIVGPSGCGKSAVVRYFAASQKLPMRDFNVGTWIVTGAKEPPTLGAIGDFLRSHEWGVIFIDEVDKLVATTDWVRSIQQEVYALLDGRTDSFPSWDKEARKKLERDFFIVGAGTWQTRYRGRQRALGFGANEASDAWAIELEHQDEIPEELIMRFNADVLYLRPLTKEEFVERIVAIHDTLTLARPTDERLYQLSEKAIASRRHNRWLEAYASRMLRTKAR